MQRGKQGTLLDPIAGIVIESITISQSYCRPQFLKEFDPREHLPNLVGILHDLELQPIRTQ